MMQCSLPILCLLSFGCLVVQREIELPAIHDENRLSLQKGLTQIIQEPGFEFEQVYKREVYKIKSEGVQPFPICQENEPEIQFYTLDDFLLVGKFNRPLVITDFNDIKYSKYLLDLFYEANSSRVTIMFNNAIVTVIDIQDGAIKQTNWFSVQGLSYSHEPLEAGYFIQVGGDLLFVNGQRVIKVSKNSATLLSGFQLHTEFESVYCVQNKYFAVLETNIGVSIYHYKGNEVIKMAVIEGESLRQSSSSQFKDLIYCPQNKALLILDSQNGINYYTLEINESGNRSSVRLLNGSIISSATGCKLMYRYSNRLYAYCEDLLAINLDDWPRVEQKRLPYPNMEVQEIYELNNILTLVGRDSFSVFYLQRLTNYYQDAHLDKLLFFDDKYISANEGSVSFGNVRVVKPVIRCYANEDQDLGIAKLLFKTKAECNSTFMKEHNISVGGQIGPDDICIYTIYKDINIWKEGKVESYPFIITLVLLQIVVFVSLVVFLCKKRKIDKMVQMINDFSTINAQSDSAKPMSLNIDTDDIEGSDQKKPPIKNKEEEKEKNMGSQLPLGNNMEDFA